MDTGQSEQWLALAREAGIAAEHLGIGVTALGRANYAQHAYYGQAFFALSIGFERSAKLALVVDHALDHSGRFPPNSEIRKFGHSLRELLEALDDLAARRRFGAESRMPSSEIHENAIDVLSDFASNVTRYYNLDFVTGKSSAQMLDDPISAWWNRVTIPIADKHYNAKLREKDARQARQLQALFGDWMFVRMTTQSGAPLRNAESAALQTAITDRAHPYERMYILQIARSIANIMSNLGHLVHTTKLDCPYLGEFFAIFRNPDSYFRQRKTWTIY
jgi:hypothetical protein